MNPAYKHLSDRLKIGELTVPQMIGLFCGLMGGLVFALYLSPFSPYLTLAVSIYIASIPAGAVLLAGTTEFDAWLFIRALVSDVTTDGRYAAGPGETSVGYAIDAEADNAFTTYSEREPFDLEAIWDT